VKNTKLSSMIYPLMQALDEEYLNCDAQFGGKDQRKIFTFAMKYLPQLQYKKRIHLMNPMIEGLNNEKMSSSDLFSKIEYTESKEEIFKKIKKCFCEEKSTKGGLFQIIKYVILPILKIKGVEMEIKTLDNNIFIINSYDLLEKEFLAGNVHPGDLKMAVSNYLELIIQPIRDVIKRNEHIVREAYPNEKNIF
ncbi:hypothetical protein H311_00644, partial [Anncaliia algerae PRA109]